jgi:hypothetical protein
MKAYFVRTNGCSVHGGSRAEAFVAGEPEGRFDYREKCLAEGFARIGWPNTGDLRNGLAARLAPHGYSLGSISDRYRRYLERWADISVGDLILIPAGEGKYQAHLGVVTLRDRDTRQEIESPVGAPAYYFFHDVANGEYYECAHRVDVRWHRSTAGTAVVHHFPEIGGLWLSAFGELKTGAQQAERVALSAGLLE